MVSSSTQRDLPVSDDTNTHYPATKGSPLPVTSGSPPRHGNDTVRTSRHEDDCDGIVKIKPLPSWHYQSATTIPSTLEGTVAKGTIVTRKSSTSSQPSNVSSGTDAKTPTFPTSTFSVLEYPPLYFLLRHVPCLLHSIQSFYTFRWWVSYPLQRRVVFSDQLRRLHIYMTYGELLLLLPYYLAVLLCSVYTIVLPSVSNTGRLCRFTLIAALMFSQRNSFITLFFGIPVDRGLFYHKLAGRVAGMTGLLHTMSYYLDPKYRPVATDDTSSQGLVSDLFANSINSSGTLMVLILVALIISSIGPIRRHMFELFYYLHIVFAIAFIICTYFHSGWMVPSFAMATMGLDWFIRSILMARLRYPKNASIKIMTETVVELTFPKGDIFQYNPGQYIYIAVPEISCFQWHPFSIVSSPNEPTVKLLIRKLGNWTTALHELAKTKSQISFLVEGPYGNLSVDLLAHDRKYRHVMLIGGGIGVTPMESIYDHLVNEVHAGRQELRRIKFVWVERELTFADQRETVLKKKAVQLSHTTLNTSVSGTNSMEEEDDSAGSIYIKEDNTPAKELLSLQLLNLSSCGITEEERYDSDKEVFPDDDTLNNTNAMFDFSPDLEEDRNATKLTGEDILDLEIYLTSTKPDETLSFDPRRKNTQYGRPNIPEIFLRMKRDVLIEAFASLSDGTSSDLTIDNTTIGEQRIAVCISAPRALTNACRKACLKYSDDIVKFDFHYESMSI